MSSLPFSISVSKNRLFPFEVLVGGALRGVNPDFRNVLKICRLLEDNQIIEAHKYQLLCRFFYTGEGGLPEIDEGALGFADFVSGGFSIGNPSPNNPNSIELNNAPLFDFEFDAPELYWSFLSEYGIDLLDVDFLHFYKFRLLLAGLPPDSAFMRKLSLRFMDLSNLKGKELSRAISAKERVALPERLSYDEKTKIAEFERVWGNF